MQQEITAPIKKELEQFRNLFAAAVAGREGLLGDVLAHVAATQGKAMRPILTLLIAKALYIRQHSSVARAAATITRRPTYERTLHAACSLELLHTASLLHDDVVDEADERRGQPSANAVFSNKIAVLVGDYILSTSIAEAMQCREPRITEALARLGSTLAEGEVLQQQALSAGDFSADAYYDIIGRKTAALFETCCLTAAISVGAKEEDLKAAAQFGHDLGVAFQIRDDMFDYTDSTDIGKPTGNDMREGKLTLPVLFVLADPQCPAETVAAAKRVRKLSASDTDIAALIEYTQTHGGLNHARQQAEAYADRARAFIADIPDEKLARALTAYLDFAVNREK